MTLLSAFNLGEFVSTIIYTTLGVAMMALFWWIIAKLSPFSIVREIEEDQNVALAILIGAVFIALAIIIAGVIRS
ncbi:MAG: DUF350 domain-containing protein [Rhodobacter sp.]|uniref:DUF350 domain-containing protein n=1 Tax=Pararhodobacter sp. TaxID=2127056 RepID=UPI001D4F2FDC|nr:DUF350 domain-containing protein [Pararhodobacter sp.]MCB1343947.1 DUF350 domain-containing protein [Paracoccaceae bacterium]MCC0074293.1 DUF350 domain-containing protein [Rhodobacter sp.]HPD91624.1 DUF350 domain-containing protein [Pararhodobacter sp.]